MNILAFEASTRLLSVALWRDGELTEKSADVPNGGSERLLPWANALLAESGVRLSQMDGIAFGAGPGGFTGLRLACGVAQGLAFGLDAPVLPVGTLAALALASGPGKVLACLEIKGIDYEVDPARGHISWISPVARALNKAREGDVVTLRTPGGVEELEILEVRYVAL